MNSETRDSILLSLLEGEKRFSELIKEGKKGSIARVLVDLLEYGYIKRRLINAKPPKTMYSITKTGRKSLLDHKDEIILKHMTALNRIKLLDKLHILQ